MNTRRFARRNGARHGEDPGAYQRGLRDGRVWAHDYATPDELRGLVDNFEPGRSADFAMDHSVSKFMNGREHKDPARLAHHDGPFWRGFVAGAEEALNELGRPGAPPAAVAGPRPPADGPHQAE
jgi:hypothetical protein